MEITEVKIFPVSEEKLRAFVSIVFDHCFMVNDIKVIHGRDGLFISMPSRRKKNGDFKDVAHPLNNETRSRIEDRILAEYGHVLQDRDAGQDELPRAVEIPQRPAAPPLAARAAVSPVEAAPREERSLQEVEELHLRDSFWSVP